MLAHFFQSFRFASSSLIAPVLLFVTYCLTARQLILRLSQCISLGTAAQLAIRSASLRQARNNNPNLNRQLPDLRAGKCPSAVVGQEFGGADQPVTALGRDAACISSSIAWLAPVTPPKDRSVERSHWSAPGPATARPSDPSAQAHSTILPCSGNNIHPNLCVPPRPGFYGCQ